MKVPLQKSLAVAVGKNLESQGEMLVNEAGDSVMSLCLFSVLIPQRLLDDFHCLEMENMPLSVKLCALVGQNFKFADTVLKDQFRDEGTEVLVFHCYSLHQIPTNASTNDCSAYSSSLRPWNIWEELEAGWRISKEDCCYKFLLNTVPFWEPGHLRLSSNLRTFLRLQFPPCADTAQHSLCMGSKNLRVSRAAGERKGFISAWQALRDEKRGILPVLVHRPVLLCPSLLQPPSLPPRESHKSLSLMQHSNPVTSLVALALEADTLCCAGPPEMLWEKQWC